jgi:hypothetical protein
LSFMRFIMVVCPCSLQTLWWSSNMCLKINGGMPNASRGLSLKKSLPVINRERCKHEYTEIWNCFKPSTKGDAFVRCSTCQTDFSHVYTAVDLIGLVNEVITAIFEICRWSCE